MNLQIILASLKARPVRTVVSVLAVALEVTLILLLVGLATGIVDETSKRPAGVGAEIVFLPPESSYIIAMNSGAMPIEKAIRIAEVEGVAAVAPVLTVTNPGSGFNVIAGIDPVSFDAVSGGFTYKTGRMFQGTEEALVDDVYANSENVKVGDVISVLTRRFKISGIVESGKASRIFIPLGVAQEMNGRLGKASMFYVKLQKGADVKQVLARMGKGTDFEGNQVVDANEFASLMSKAVSGIMNAFFKVVVFIGVSIGVLVIFLSMYTTITERTREIGILRSLGASKGYVIALILQESIFICAGGIVLGIGASYLLSDMITRIFPTIIVLITPGWLIAAAILAVLSGIIGSLYPSIKAANKDPVEALAYE